MTLDRSEGEKPKPKTAVSSPSRREEERREQAQHDNLKDAKRSDRQAGRSVFRILSFKDKKGPSRICGTDLFYFILDSGVGMDLESK